MTARRSRGDGGLSWSETRQRWVAAITIGYTPTGRRIVRRASGRTKTEARAKLKEILRDHDDGLTVTSRSPTVSHAVHDWLDHGLGGRDPGTVETLRILARQHVIPALGQRKLQELSAEDVDRWLADKARSLSTSTLARVKSILARSISRAQARDKVKRNVVLLCETPTGQAGRPSKALTLDQAHALLDAATGSTIGAYITVSLLTGARTEELRPLTWSHVDLDGNPRCCPPDTATCEGLALGPSRRGHQDQAVAADSRTPPACGRRASRAAQPPDRRSALGSATRQPRSRVRLRSRHRLGLGQRPARLPTHRHHGRSARRRVDTAGAAA